MTRYSNVYYRTNRNYHKKYDTIWYGLFLTFGALSYGVAVWAIVEFILYLVKDNPFNWLSLWITIGLIVAEIVIMIKMFLAD